MESGSATVPHTASGSPASPRGSLRRARSVRARPVPGPGTRWDWPPPRAPADEGWRKK